MKGGKVNKGLLVAIAGISLFLGFVVFMAGLGAVFPAITNLPAQLICEGEVVSEIEDVSYRPGEYRTANYVYCETDGSSKDITLQAFALTGLIYSTMIFILLTYKFRKKLIVDNL